MSVKAPPDFFADALGFPTRAQSAKPVVMTTEDTIAAYFAAFNEGDAERMLALVADDLEHHVNQGEVRHGIEAFREFCALMSRCYRERLADIVIFANDDGTRGAAEFVVHGEYLQSDQGLPEARGQKYVLPAGSFFSLTHGKISRVVTYYNLEDWLSQVRQPTGTPSI